VIAETITSTLIFIFHNPKKTIRVLQYAANKTQCDRLANLTTWTVDLC